MSTVRFGPSGPLRGRMTPPADKSVSHRALLIGAMCADPVPIHNLLEADDVRSTARAVRSLGSAVEAEASEVVVRGAGLHAALETTGGRLDVGNAGTLLRLLPGWLAGQAGGVWILDGDESIRRRPVDRIAAPLRAMGANISAREDRLPPLTVEGASLRGITYRLPMSSAQVKSCLLFAGLLANGPTALTEPFVSRDHTERLLTAARVPIERDGATVRVGEVDELELDEVRIPGDPSSAAFFVAAAALVPRSRLVLDDVGVNWTRTGFLAVARRMGAVVLGELEPRPESGRAPIPDREPVAQLDVAGAPLEATRIGPDEVPLIIDELPLVALLACFAEGETVVSGAQELRLKESDRITTVVEGLRGLGGDLEATDDGFVVRGGGGLRGGTIDAHGDHRLAMLGAVAGLASDEGVEVVGMEAAAISYPGFENDLRRLARG